jgi:[ribosomal protein S5]-alanine N-acetyltransferase
VCQLQRLRGDHLEAVLAFERANRAYFATLISDRGDDFYERYAEHHREALAEQDRGACIFHVLVDQNGALIGRFNLYDVADGSAEVGYRVAQHAVGRGVATSGVRELCRRAQTEYGLRMLTARTRSTGHASQRVLEKAGFSAGANCDVGGRPGVRYSKQLTPGSVAAR